VYPSGKVSASHRKKFNPDPVVKAREVSEDERWNLVMLKHQGVESAIELKKRFSSEKASSLGLSKLSKSEKTRERVRRGLKGITAHGRQRVRDGASVIEKEYGKGNLVFLTCTLPPECVNLSPDQWSKIIDLFKRKILYRLGQEGIDLKIIGVTEVQEKRLEERGEIALHLHWVFPGRKKDGVWVFKPCQLTDMWKKCVEGVLIDRNLENVKWNAAINVQRVKKTVVAYLGKYLSKGAKVLGKIQEMGLSDLIPKAWYICTQQLHESIEKATRYVTGAEAEKLWEFFEKYGEHLFSFQRFVKIDLPDGSKRTVGWYAYPEKGFDPTNLEAIIRCIPDEGIANYSEYSYTMTGNIQYLECDFYPSYKTIMQRMRQILPLGVMQEFRKQLSMWQVIELDNTKNNAR
jgi:hypothetical protein